ncbi:glycosyltransferase [Vibrio rumoiensis]|uniref:Glycosyltransferase n=1 Tax=Vibrio rumoiensis TaxID=76258 RepID=A0ABW7IRG8_9VIBR
MNNNKICFVNTSQSWGGGEKWHHHAAVMCSQSAKVTVISQSNSKLLDSLRGYNINSVEFNITNTSFLNPFKMFKLYKHFKQHQYSSIVLNLPADVKSAGIAAKFAGIKKIFYRRGMPHPIRNTTLNRYLFGKVVTDVIVNSDEIGRSIVKNNPNIIPASSIHTIYNGVNIDEYDKDNIEPIIAKEPNVITLGTAGRCVNQKNQLMLIDVMAQLKQRGHKVKLYIAGTGPLYSQLESAISSNHLDNEITLLGFVKDTKGFLASLDLFIFPSHYEGSSNAIIEALAMGLPTVAFDVSSMPEMVIDGMTGRLAEYDKIESFTDATESLIVDTELRQKTSHNAKKLVQDKFNNQIIFEKINRLLSS